MRSRGDVRAPDVSVRVLPGIFPDDSPHRVEKRRRGPLGHRRELFAGVAIDESGALVEAFPQFESGLRDPGMSAVLSHLAKDEIVELEVEIVSVRHQAQGRGCRGRTRRDACPFPAASSRRLRRRRARRSIDSIRNTPSESAESDPPPWTVIEAPPMEEPVTALTTRATIAPPPTAGVLAVAPAGSVAEGASGPSSAHPQIESARSGPQTLPFTSESVH